LLLRALLVSNVTVLQCDVDALLLRNPIPLLMATAGDVVGQRGTFPFRIHKSWGATLCFGVIMYALLRLVILFLFFLFFLCFLRWSTLRRSHMLRFFCRYRPTAATLAWFDMALPRFSKNGDDQSEFQRSIDACTRVVWNHGHTWPATKEEHRSLKPKPQSDVTDYGVTQSAITREGTRLNATLLPSTKFPRKCGSDVGNPEQQESCMIAHCISPKGSGHHKEVLNVKLGLAFLKAGWENDIRLPSPLESPEEYLLKLGSGKHPSLKAAVRNL
jgi:hypothetical protein